MSRYNYFVTEYGEVLPKRRCQPTNLKGVKAQKTISSSGSDVFEASIMELLNSFVAAYYARSSTGTIMEKSTYQ